VSCNPEGVNGEHVIHTNRAPITVDITCSKCWRIWRYDVPVTLVLTQLLADEGWSLPDNEQICAECQRG